MSKTRLFLENFLIYGLGGVISKIIPFIMLPFITRLMPDTKYFGIADMSSLTCSFGMAVAIMGMYDAVFRLFFDKDDRVFQQQILSTALLFVLINSLILSLLLYIFKDNLSVYIFGDKAYVNVLYLTILSIIISSSNGIIQIPCRVNNERFKFLFLNLSTSVIGYLFAIPLLVNGYYLTALPIASIGAALFSQATFLYFNYRWFNFKLFDLQILKQLMVIGLPLFPSFIIYWILNSSDRLMITNMLGNHQTGIYAIGTKVASASHLIYTAFAGGWQYFAFSTMKDQDQVKNNSKVFEYLGVISFIGAAFMCAISLNFFELFFKGEYIKGYIVAPYLFLGPLLLMLFQVIGNQFLVVKKTWPSMIILTFGALVNIVLNFWLIQTLGIEGASIATLIGYSTAVIVCSIVLIKLKLMVVSSKFIICTILIITYFVVWRLLLLDNFVLSLITATLYMLIVCYFYRGDISFIVGKIKLKFKRES